MPTYKAPLQEYRFLLRDTFNVEQYAALPGFRDAPLDVVDQILDEAAKLAEEVLQPLNQIGDIEGCKLENGVVTTPKGFKEAYKTLVEGGWPALVADPAFGGQGLPNALGVIFNEMVSSANMAFGMYPGLSHGAYSALLHHGAD
ncbi:MAG TPA: acyl-CoA dehydrogenase N-terminal domain-containing protein, partial [Parvibaculum sp.]